MDTATIDIDAPPEAVYDLVADITNMGRWSPECYRTAWVDGATTAVPGARFKGWNRTKVFGIPAKWATTSTIRQADRGRAFSFDTGLSGARWTYRFEPTDDGNGCTVTETREDANPTLLVKLAALPLEGIRHPQLTNGMQVTLERLKAAAEAEVTPT
ncbi:SRPBCC family protein [Aquihabitans daechungensis]|uniref:SRPBCC family protein n=1 Tax=Aquihabitans daechungensis TaxID=1052257 RepID=UPI003B9F3ACA